MPNYQKFIVVGHLGKDPEMKTVGAKDTELTEGTVAVSVGWGDRKHTVWWDFVVWGRQAPWAAESKKGDAVLIEGEIEEQKWTDKEGGERSKRVIRATEFRALGPKTEGSSVPVKSRKLPEPDLESDDIPF